jgi:hypothetical protein
MFFFTFMFDTKTSSKVCPLKISARPKPYLKMAHVNDFTRKYWTCLNKIGQTLAYFAHLSMTNISD